MTVQADNPDWLELELTPQERGDLKRDAVRGWSTSAWDRAC